MNLYQTSSKYQDLIENYFNITDRAVLITNLDGTITYSNEASAGVLGFDAGELQFKELAQFFTPEDMEVFYPNLLQMAAKKRPFHGEVMLLKKDGSRFFSNLTILPASSPDQPQSVIMVVIQNIDHQKALEKELNERKSGVLEETASKLTGVLSGFMDGIESSVDNLVKPKENRPDPKQSYSEIKKNISDLKDGLELYDKLNSLGRPELSRRNIREIITEFVSAFNVEENARNVRLVNEVDDEFLLLDAKLIIKAVSILSGFLFNRTGEGGVIAVRSENKDNQIRLFVSSSRPDFSLEEIADVFEPFHRGKKIKTAGDLVLIRRIMELHEGSIDVMEEEQGKIVFVFSFPWERRRYIRIWPL